MSFCLLDAIKKPGVDRLPLETENLIETSAESSVLLGRGRRTVIKRGMAGQEVKHLEECSVANALGTWVFSVAGALIAIPVGIKRKSLGPLVFFGTTGTMLDIIMGITQCEREHAEHQAKLLEAQTSALDASFSETGSES